MGKRLGDINPRKQPYQKRAQATVDAIFTATAQILVEQGYERATTARIAERAGVSIGSLYQYFPNKEGLVAGLVERHASEIVSILRAALEDTAHLSFEQGLAAFIKAGVAAHRLDPALHKILFEQVPRIGRIGHVMDTGREVTSLVETFLRRHAAALRPGLDLAIAAIIVETAAEAIVHKCVVERPDLLEQQRVDREVVDLIVRYLRAA